uniref:Nuclear receptor domain-containing protein n=1 Tax=Steinernema glaseri TaxID=37863 RepID=A0A1I7Y756_9BILA
MISALSVVRPSVIIAFGQLQSRARVNHGASEIKEIESSKNERFVCVVCTSTGRNELYFYTRGTWKGRCPLCFVHRLETLLRLSQALIEQRGPCSLRVLFGRRLIPFSARDQGPFSLVPKSSVRAVRARPKQDLIQTERINPCFYGLDSASPFAHRRSALPETVDEKCRSGMSDAGSPSVDLLQAAGLLTVNYSVDRMLHGDSSVKSSSSSPSPQPAASPQAGSSSGSTPQKSPKASLANQNGRCVGCGSTTSIRVHYGAASCHGCKAFFRRSVFDARTYRCHAKGNCDINNESRNRCRACRFRKCTLGGMNPKHVREERNKDRPIKVEGPEAGPADATDVEQRSRNADLSFAAYILTVDRNCELITDLTVSSENTNIIEKWGRDVSLKCGLQNPQLITKRTPLNWSCERIMQDDDLYAAWYRNFVLLADWCMSIACFKMLSEEDQTVLFRKNFMMFGWLHFAFKIKNNGDWVGLPIGNGSYIPYSDEGLEQMEVKWARTYGVICKKLVDMVAKPLKELDVDETEYCLTKTLALFQHDSSLSDNGTAMAKTMRDKLIAVLARYMEARFPHMTAFDRSSRLANITLLFPSLMHIGQIETDVMSTMGVLDSLNLSGIPMELSSSMHRSNLATLFNAQSLSGQR